MQKAIEAAIAVRRQKRLAFFRVWRRGRFVKLGDSAGANLVCANDSRSASPFGTAGPGTSLPAPLERVIPVNRRQQFAHHHLPRSRLTGAWAIRFQSQALRIPDTDSSEGES